MGIFKHIVERGSSLGNKKHFSTSGQFGFWFSGQRVRCRAPAARLRMSQRLRFGSANGGGERLRLPGFSPPSAAGLLPGLGHFPIDKTVSLSAS